MYANSVFKWWRVHNWLVHQPFYFVLCHCFMISQRFQLNCTAKQQLQYTARTKKEKTIQYYKQKNRNSVDNNKCANQSIRSHLVVELAALVIQPKFVHFILKLIFNRKVVGKRIFSPFRVCMLWFLIKNTHKWTEIFYTFE